MENPQVFTIKGRPAFQCGNEIIERVVLQEDGNYWKYRFYKGRSVGVPQRSKRFQVCFANFVLNVLASLK